MASTTFADDLSAASTSPYLRTVEPGGALSNSAALAAKPSVLCVAAGPRSHATLSCLRACCACHQVSATIAMPGSMPGSHGVYAAGVMPPSMTRTWRTPGSALIWSMFALFTLPANTGAFSMAAYNIPGSSISMPKSGLPVTRAWVSTPGCEWPMMR